MNYPHKHKEIRGPLQRSKHSHETANTGLTKKKTINSEAKASDSKGYNYNCRVVLIKRPHNEKLDPKMTHIKTNSN